MKNSDYLIPVKPGEVRNPKGKPKGTRNRATIYREVLDIAAKANGITIDTLPPDADMATAIAYSIAMKAYHDGDVQAAREAFDSAFGKNADVLIDQSGPKKMVMVVTNGDIDEDPPPTE